MNWVKSSFDRQLYIAFLLVGLLFASLMLLKADLVLLIPLAIFGLFCAVWVFQKNRLILYFFALLSPIEVGFYLPGLFGAVINGQALCGILILTFMALKIYDRKRIPAIPYIGLWFAYVVLATVSYFFGPLITSPIQGLWSIYRLVFATALLYPAVWFFTSRTDHLRWAFVLIAVSAAAFSVVALIQVASNGKLMSGMLTNGRFLGFLFPLPPETWLGDPTAIQANLLIGSLFRAHGAFYRTNGFGAYMSIVVGLTWGLMRGFSGRKRILFVGLLILQILAVIASFSRSAWVATIAALGAAILLELWFMPEKKNFFRVLRVLGFVVVIGFVILMVALQFEAVSQRFETLTNIGEVAQLSWRVEIWKEALLSIQAHPLWGTGQTVVMNMPDSKGDHDVGAHNLLIGIAFKNGLGALAVVTIFTLILAASAWRGLQRSHTFQDRMLALGILAGLVAFLISGVGSALFDIDNVNALFWFMTAASIRIRQMTKISKV